MLRFLRRSIVMADLRWLSGPFCWALLLCAVLVPASPCVLVWAQESSITEQAPAAPLFTLQEVMIPVRDGVHLQTAILTPVNQTGPLPILFRRTPYGVPDKPYTIDWSSPAALLEKIIRYEAVHEIGDWDELRRRIDPADRRCYAFFIRGWSTSR